MPIFCEIDSGVPTRHDIAPPPGSNLFDRGPSRHRAIQWSNEAPFQFSLRALIVSLTMAAIIAWAIRYVGVGTAFVLLLASPVTVGALFRRPLEGVLLSAFLVVLLFSGGFMVLALALPK
jgi:hypothetical protein